MLRPRIEGGEEFLEHLSSDVSSTLAIVTWKSRSSLHAILDVSQNVLVMKEVRNIIYSKNLHKVGILT